VASTSVRALKKIAACRQLFPGGIIARHKLRSEQLKRSETQNCRLKQGVVRIAEHAAYLLSIPKVHSGSTSPMFGLVRGLCIVAAFVSSAASSGHAQTDLTAAKQAVRECIAQVRQEATRRENYDEFGQPPIWRNFDAYVSPDGLVHNNIKFVGERDGAYRFEKCLADHGFSLGSGASNNAPKPTDTCTQDEFLHPGDCWIKLPVWAKQTPQSLRQGAPFRQVG
jgi:hypothetical protein